MDAPVHCTPHREWLKLQGLSLLWPRRCGYENNDCTALVSEFLMTSIHPLQCNASPSCSASKLQKILLWFKGLIKVYRLLNVCYYVWHCPNINHKSFVSICKLRIHLSWMLMCCLQCQLFVLHWLSFFISSLNLYEWKGKKVQHHFCPLDLPGYLFIYFGHNYIRLTLLWSLSFFYLSVLLFVCPSYWDTLP